MQLSPCSTLTEQQPFCWNLKKLIKILMMCLCRGGTLTVSGLSWQALLSGWLHVEAGSLISFAFMVLVIL